MSSETDQQFVERISLDLDLSNTADIQRLFDLARRGAAAEFLFGLLDDIDTADDAAKSDMITYRQMVRKINRRRFEVASTDGYNVTFLPPPPSGEPRDE